MPCWSKRLWPNSGHRAGHGRLRHAPSRRGPRAHPDFPLFQARPGAGPVFAPRLLVALWRPTRTYASAAARQTIGGHRTGHGTQREAVLGPLAPPVSNVPPTNVRGVGGGIDPACLLGPALLPAATRQGQSPSGGGTGLGVHMDPPPLSRVGRTAPCMMRLASLQALTPRGSSLMPNLAK